MFFFFFFKVQANPRKLYVSSSAATCSWKRHEECGGTFGQNVVWYGCEKALALANEHGRKIVPMFDPEPPGGLSACAPINGWSSIVVPGNENKASFSNQNSFKSEISKILRKPSEFRFSHKF